MRFFVTFDVFETIHSADDVKRARESAGQHIQKLQSSGKMIDGGIFGDRRVGFSFSILTVQQSCMTFWETYMICAALLFIRF